MSDQPLVSILIPVYNRENFIASTIASACAQTHRHLEIVVVDNCSTDGTWGQMERAAAIDSRVKLFRNESNLGPLRNWRRCIDLATGEYGKILFSDDAIEPTFVEKCLAMMHGKPEVGFVYAGVLIHQVTTGQKTPAYFIGPTGIHDSLAFLEISLMGGITPVSPGCALFRRADLDRFTLIDIPNRAGVDFSRHGMGNDLLIFLLTAAHYPKFGFLAEPLCLFRSHDDSISIKALGGKGDGNLMLNYEISRAYFAENFLQHPALQRRYFTKILSMCFSAGNDAFDWRLLEIMFSKTRPVPVDYAWLQQALDGRLAKKQGQR